MKTDRPIVRVRHVVAAGLVFTAGAAVAADGAQGAARPRPTQTVRTAVCASDLGAGIKSRRRFCDVIIVSTARESVSMAIPAHSGPATLMFDLHNRFIVPAPTVDASQAFTKQTAVVAVIRPTGEVIERAAVSREYRSPADLFDRIAGSGRGAPAKAVAPGQAQAVRVTIPAGVNAIGIVGTRLEEWRATGRGAFDAPGKAIAMVSNLRIQYTPR